MYVRLTKVLHSTERENSQKWKGTQTTVIVKHFNTSVSVMELGDGKQTKLEKR